MACDQGVGADIGLDFGIGRDCGGIDRGERNALVSTHVCQGQVGSRNGRWKARFGS